MEEYVNQVKNICSQTLNNDGSDYDDKGVLLHAILHSIMDPGHFWRYNLDNPSSPHWKIFTVIEVFAKTSNGCLYPNQDEKDMKVWTFWALNRLMCLGLISEGFKLSPCLAKTCAAVIRFIERHGASAATEFLHFVTSAFGEVVKFLSTGAKGLEIRLPTFGDSTEMLRVTRLGMVPLKFQSLKLRSRLDLCNFGSLLCELVARLAALILANNESLMDRLVQDIKTFAEEGNSFAKITAVEALDSLLCKFGTEALRRRTVSDLGSLTEFLLTEARDGRMACLSERHQRRFEASLSLFLTVLLRVEGVNFSAMAQRYLCTFLVRCDGQFAGTESVLRYLKCLRAMPRKLFRMLLTQFTVDKTEQHLEVCQQLLHRELYATSKVDKHTVFLEFWDQLLAGPGPVEMVDSLDDTMEDTSDLGKVAACRSFALAWSCVLRERADLRTPRELFAQLLLWMQRCLQHHENAEPGQLRGLLQALQGMAGMAHSVGGGDGKDTDWKFFINILMSPFLDLPQFESMPRRFRDINLVALGSRFAQELLQGACLTGLVLVSRRVDIHMLCLVFQAGLQDPTMRCEVIQTLPNLGVALGSDSLLQWIDLVRTAIGILKTQPALFSEVAPSLKLLPCLLSGSLLPDQAPGRAKVLPDLVCRFCRAEGAPAGARGESEGGAFLEVLGGLTDLVFDPDTEDSVVISGLEVFQCMLRHVTPGTAVGSVIACCLKSLPLLRHSSFRIRILFSEVILDLYNAMVINPKCEKIWDAIVKELEQIFDQEEGSVLDSAVVTACNIAKIANEDHFSELLPCVLLVGTSRRHGLRGLLWSGVTTMMQDRKLNQHHLLSNCRSSFAQTIVRHLYRKPPQDGANANIDSILAAMSVFLGISKCDFFQAMLPDLFFEFVLRCDDRAHEFIREMITCAPWLEHTNYPDRLTESRVLPETFVSLFSRCSESNHRSLAPFFAFLAQHCRTSVERIATFNDVTRLIHQLLLRLDGTNNAGIIRGLRWVFTDVLKTVPAESRTPGTPGSVSYSHLMDLLQEYFYGALVKMDHVLLQTEAAMKEKLRVLVSLSAALKMFGPRAVTDNRLKILGTLKIGMTLQEKVYTEEIAKAWCNFLQAVEKSALCSMMTEIVACLLNLHPRSPERVTELLSFLIIDNRESLHAVFPDLHFFPRDIPALQACRAILDEALYAQDSVLSAQIAAYFPGLASENNDIRLCSLRNLFSTLRAHLSTVTVELLLETNATTVRPLIAKLLRLLLQGCQRDSSSPAEMRLLYARCLGAIGPLDPGRMAEELIAGEAEGRMRSREVVLAADDFFFPFEVLSQLCRVHMCSESPKQQEATAVSIQELLKAYNIDRETIDSATTAEPEPDQTMDVELLSRSASGSVKQVQGRDLWVLFEAPIQEIILPLLNAKYAISAYTDWSKVNRPLFLRPRLDSHARWVQLWAGSMNQFVNSRANHVFLDCEPVTKTDESFAQFILPFAFLQILLDGNEEHMEKLRSEIGTIFNLVRNCRQSPGHQAFFRRRFPWYRLACQTIFSALDHCRRWLTRRRQSFASTFKPADQPEDGAETVDAAIEREDQLYCQVAAFIASIPHELQAVAALGSGCLTRSLQHYELAYLALSEQENVEPGAREAIAKGLLAAYSSLRELDGAEGVRRALLTKDDELSLAQQRNDRIEARVLQLLEARVPPALPAPDLAEQLFELDVRDPARLVSLPVTLESLVAREPTWNGPLNRFRVQAAWKLCNWRELDDALAGAQPSSRVDWNVGIGHVLGALQKKNAEGFEAEIGDEYLLHLDPICASAMQCVSYERVYDNISKLGALFDIESMSTNVLKAAEEDGERLSQDVLIKVLNTRLEVSRADHLTMDHRLAIRGSILSMIDWRAAQADNCFRRARLARSAGLHSAALTFLMEAERLCPEMEQLGLEHCRLLWDEGKKDSALTSLERMTKKILDRSPADVTPVAGETLLFDAFCSDLSGRNAYNETKAKYEQSLRFLPNSEEAHFRLAHYADRTLDQLPSDKRKERQELLCFALQHYGEALCYGSEFADQSMPRMLSRWLDCGDSSTGRSGCSGSSGLQEVQRRMRLNMGRIPSFQFYFCFTQLTSAVVHENAEVLALLSELIVKITTAFPQQCLWWLMGLQESKIPARKEACRVVFEKLKANNRHMVSYLQDIQALSGHMKEVGVLFLKNTKHAPKAFMISSHVKALLRLVERQSFSRIMIPLQRLMSVAMPSASKATGSAPNLRTHNAFPHTLIHLRGIRDRVEVLSSLTRPKKVVWKGSDGKDYIMVAKPEDDLRKDSRIMQLNENINRWILLNAETRGTIQSSMIRCFAVIPLGENGGIIEWVNNTDGFRNIVLNLYKERNIVVDWGHLQMIGPQLNDSKAEKRRKFEEVIFPKFASPVLPGWFLRTFPDTNAWFQARSRYIRSLAVMSMIGYLIGLGDRHGENILFDCSNGEIVHVDFNCIFNKGRCYKWPEMVPFRLTHNLLAAFGPSGYEGQFRACCEAVMRLMRSRADSMLAVFRPVVLEMMLECPSEWFSSERRQDVGARRKYALAKLGDVENRLHGRMTDEGALNQLPMSEEGQVEMLLRQATDVNLLSQMFIGWASFL